jgi:Lipocalin-like domain
MNRLAWTALGVFGVAGTVSSTEPARVASPLAGTWILVAAELIRPDGNTVDDYGAAPKGLLIVDADGRYSLQIFKSERPHFASPDKAKATAEEYAAAVMGSSTHFGTVEVDEHEHVLNFRILASSFPNWEGTTQKRSYTLDGGLLKYRVPPRPDGGIPVSVWRRAE